MTQTVDSLAAGRNAPWRDGILRAVFAILLMLPWLWPFTPGPSANAAPLMVSWACLSISVLLAFATDSAAALKQAVPSAWLMASLVSCIIGLAQWFGIPPETSLISPARIGEAYGNLRQRNQFAGLTSLGLAALICLATQEKRQWWPLAAVLLAFANAASASRTGLAQWVIITLLSVAWPGPRRRRFEICAFAGAAYFGASVLLPQLFMHFHGIDAPNALSRALSEPDCGSRLVLWSNVLQLISEHPWIGWGLGELDYAHYTTLYPGPRFCDILDNAHNLPLHLAVELGVPAALLATGACLAAILRARPWFEQNPQRQLAWTAIAIIALHSLVEYPLWYGPFELAVLYAIWLLLPARAIARTALRIFAAAALAVLLGILHALSQYDIVSQAYKPAAERRPAFRIDPVTAAGSLLLFDDQLKFAELSVTPLTPATAQRVHRLARAMLHFSPEPGVVEKLIESARLLGLTEEAAWHAARFQAAFPEQYRMWMNRQPQWNVPREVTPE